MPVSPGILEKWVAPGAIVAGCGAVAWWLARSALTSAQPALLAAAVPFGAAGAMLGNVVHQERNQVSSPTPQSHLPMSAEHLLPDHRLLNPQRIREVQAVCVFGQRVLNAS